MESVDNYAIQNSSFFNKFDSFKPLPNEHVINHFACELFAFVSKVSVPILKIGAFVIICSAATASPLYLTFVAMAVSGIGLIAIFKDKHIVKTVPLALVGLAGITYFAMGTVAMTAAGVILAISLQKIIRESQASYGIKVQSDDKGLKNFGEHLALVAKSKREIKKLTIECPNIQLDIKSMELLLKINPRVIEIKGKSINPEDLKALNRELNANKEAKDLNYYTYDKIDFEDQHFVLTRKTIKKTTDSYDFSLGSLTDLITQVEIEQIRAISPANIGSICFDGAQIIKESDFSHVNESVQILRSLNPDKIIFERELNEKMLNICNEHFNCCLPAKDQTLGWYSLSQSKFYNLGTTSIFSYTPLGDRYNIGYSLPLSGHIFENEYKEPLSSDLVISHLSKIKSKNVKTIHFKNVVMTHGIVDQLKEMNLDSIHFYNCKLTEDHILDLNSALLKTGNSIFELDNAFLSHFSLKKTDYSNKHFEIDPRDSSFKFRISQLYQMKDVTGSIQSMCTTRFSNYNHERVFGNVTDVIDKQQREQLILQCISKVDPQTVTIKDEELSSNFVEALSKHFGTYPEICKGIIPEIVWTKRI